MSKQAESAEITALSERMLHALESLRQQDGEAYPPTLRRLSELCDVSPTDERIIKAVTKKTFTTNAVVTEKVNRKPSLDSPVYFKGDAPAKKPKRYATGKKGKDDEIAQLAERMIRILELQRQEGGEAYPPTLRRLAELCDVSPTDERIIKAVGKKTFTAKATITKRVGKKPSLDSPVYFNEDVPDEIAQLAERMSLVLESQQRLGDGAYPPTLQRLVELCETTSADPLIPKAVGRAPFKDRAVIAWGKKGKLRFDALVLLKEDIEEKTPDLLPTLLTFALMEATTEKSNAFTTAELKKQLVPALQKPFGAAMDEGVKRQTLAPGVAWVWVKKNRLFFLVESLQPEALRRPLPTDGRATFSPPALREHPPIAQAVPGRDFAQAFREAFEQIDRRNGGTNIVKLADLRRALPDFDREQFDAGLRQLRLDGQFSLDSHEGLYGTLTLDERDAGVLEAGSLLVYVCRR